MNIEKCDKNLPDPLMPSHIKILVHDLQGFRYIYQSLLGKTSACIQFVKNGNINCITPLKVQKYKKSIL